MLFQLLSTFLTKGLSLVAARAMHNNMLKNLLRQEPLLWQKHPSECTCSRCYTRIGCGKLPSQASTWMCGVHSMTTMEQIHLV